MLQLILTLNKLYKVCIGIIHISHIRKISLKEVSNLAKVMEWDNVGTELEFEQPDSGVLSVSTEQNTFFKCI